MPASAPCRTGRRADPALHEQWRQRLLRFERSGLSVLAFCAAEGVSCPSFYAWRRRLRSDPVAPVNRLRLVSVAVVAPAAPVEVVLPTGPVLRLAAGCDLAFVRSLVDALGGSPC
jgi:transposase